jgi:arsenite methyltransferase
VIISNCAERGGPIGCIAGALSFTEYRRGLTEAGFTDISINPTHQVASGLHSAIIRAVRGVAGPSQEPS